MKNQKHLIALLLCFALALVLTVPAEAENSGEWKVRVSGNATIFLSADTAVLQIGLSTKKDTVQEAQAENAAVMENILNALYQAGVDPKDAVTSNYSVYTGRDYQPSETGASEEVICYYADNMLSVTVRNLKQLGTVLDAAMDAGANTMYGITFSSSKANEAYRQALTKAVEDARAKAAVLAEAANAELGEIVWMDESGTGSQPGLTNTYNNREAKQDAGIASGDVSVQADVVVEFRFTPKR